MWRYRELLPVRAEPVSLGERMTPLTRLRLAGRDVFAKDESGQPTGSFKARGLAVAITRARELGIERVVIPSAGNAAAAAAAYARAAGIECAVVLPRDALPETVAACVREGARVHAVDGHIGDCGRVVRERYVPAGWFDLSTFREPYRVEGKKTLGCEIVEQLGWAAPDVIVYPTGGGTGLIGIWKSLGEMERLGWIGGRRPRMFAVQPAGCAPVVQAWERGDADVREWNSPQTRAAGLRVPRPFAGRWILRVLRESGGAAVAVEDEAIGRAQDELERAHGLRTSPEGAACAAALPLLVERGWVGSDERIVLVFTGGPLRGSRASPR
jgi:threonine synthase